MDNFLEDDLLIICPNSYREAILKYLTINKKILNIKFMTMDEYKKSFYFNYDINAIHYLVCKDIKVANAITLLNNLYYIEDREYHEDKLDYLVNIKHELDELNLLIYDDNFKNILKRRKIVIYGYGELDNFTIKMFDNHKIIPYRVVNSKFNIYHLSTIKDEVEMVFQRIIDLLKKGIDINKISIMNINDEYLPVIKRMEHFYGIKVFYGNNDSLMGTILGEDFYNLILDNKNREDILLAIAKYDQEEEYQFIINLLNKYHDFNLKEVSEEIKYELSNKKISSKKTENVIKVKNVFDYVSDDEYVFLMNFNNGSIPTYKMDTDYITDNIKDLVGLMKVEEENLLIKENNTSYLKSIKNLVISYKDKSPFNTYYPSTLLDELDYEEKEYSRSYNYSHLANQSLYTKFLDDFVKYGVKNNDLEMLFNNYQKNDYLLYDNRFTYINKDKLIEYLHNELTLSYSSIDNYYQCGFKYYIKNILKLDLFNETFYTIIGNIFHEALSHINDDFDLDSFYEK